MQRLSSNLQLKIFYDQVADDEPPEETSANEAKEEKEEETSEQDKVEDTGTTHEVPICVAFPNHGILSDM